MLDLGTYTITDWFSSMTAFQFLDRANATLQKGEAPPPADNILINGTNKNANGGGNYGKVTLTPGKKHRLRIISTAIEASIRVSLDGHTFTVITSDFVPIKPFTTNQLLLAVGQRYDVIITANQNSGNYWFRAEAASDCATPVNHPGRSIFTYSGAKFANPTTTGVTFNSTCLEPTSLVPWWATTVPSSDFQQQAVSLPVDLAIPNITTNNQNIVSWTVNLTSIDINWEDPTLMYVMNKDTDYPKTYNLIEIPNEGTVSLRNNEHVLRHRI
jgi:FtsP/CotA-like multicopper oxidase with cupredoxin domain